MRRFETPPAPPGWTGQGATLIRIVDPLGGGIAWLAPDYGGACVGYAIKRTDDDTGWVQVLRASSPRAWRDDPVGIGVAVVGPTADDPAAASTARWIMVERDPTAATCAMQFGPARLLLTARLDASALHLDLRGEVPDGSAPPLALGLRLTFAAELHLDTTTANALALTNGDGTTRLILDSTGRDSLHRQLVEMSGNVGIEIGGADSVALALRHAR